MFRTLKKIGKGLYKEKGSKFYGYALPCKSVDDVKKNLEKLRKEHPGCVHVCYAYCLGSKKENHRYSDDGEPSNSAGAPIYGQIKSFDLTNTLIAVVRYYGGINLGVGGLINAYRSAAKEAVFSSEIVDDEEYNTIEIEFTYASMPFVMNEVKSSECIILEQHFEDLPVLKLSIPISNSELIHRLENLNDVVIKA